MRRVLNSDPKNAEAYLGLVMAEAELSGKYEFERTYTCNLIEFRQLNQNNLRHAKEFGNKELRAWLRNLEEQQKDAEVQQEKEKLAKAQTRSEEYKQIILAHLSADPEVAVTVERIFELLWHAYPGELWSHMRAKMILNTLTKDGILICVESQGFRGTYVLSESERFRLKVQEDVLAYIFVNAEVSVTPQDIMEKVLVPTYPDEQWNKMKVGSLLNALCDDAGKLNRVNDKRGNNAFMITEAERRFREEKRAEKKVALKSEQVALQEELANLKGLFTRRRRREIEARLAEIEEFLS